MNRGRAMELSHDDVRKILELIDSSAHLHDVEVDYGGFRLRVQRGGTATTSVPARPAAADQVQPAPQRAAYPPQLVEPSLAPGEAAVRAPMLGTFYRAPSPGAPPFVEVGQRVRADDTVCLIEVMKLFNSITAGTDGVVTRILAENGKLVEYNQPLVVVSNSA